MITQYNKKLSKCTKQELLFLLRIEIENRQKLLDLLEKEYDKLNKNNEDERFPSYQSNERKALLEGIEIATNIVVNFYKEW